MDATALSPGVEIGPGYRIKSKLGEGGMGAVYQAEQLRTRRLRALKVMHRSFVLSEAAWERFTFEVTACHDIHSDHLVQVIDHGVDPASGLPWMAMELLDGTTLTVHRKQQPNGVLPSLAVLEILRQLSDGLSALHARDIVHRDLKPDNLFIAQARRADVPFTLKILDFGIARLSSDALATAEDQRKYPTNTALGTPVWMAPEQWGPGNAITPQTDIWALGLMVFWMLTGHIYWKSAPLDYAALAKEILLDQLPLPSARAADFGIALPKCAGAGWMMAWRTDWVMVIGRARG